MVMEFKAVNIRWIVPHCSNCDDGFQSASISLDLEK